MKRNNSEIFIEDKKKEKIFFKIIEKIKLQLKPSKIIIFGSYAKGNFKEHSDIDIAVETNLPLSMLDCIGNFDIVNLNKINKQFKEEILKEGIVLYEESSEVS